MRSPNRLRIVHPGLLEAEVLAKLFRPLFGNELHVVFGTELQTTGRTRLNTCGLQSLPHAIGAQRAFVHLFRSAVELGNVEGTTGNAKLAANAVLLLEIDDAIGVLDDGAVRRTRTQASGIGTVHALIFAHQPLNRAIAVLVFVEFDQIPKIPACLRHRLVGVVEGSGGERHVVPLHARNLAGLAADASRGIDQLANIVVALRPLTRDRSGMG